MNDLISRQAAIMVPLKERGFDEMIAYFNRRVSEMDIAQDYKMELLGMVIALGLKHENTEQRWIPVSERLPKNTEPVNITWVNRKPEPYYADIKDKPFTATGHYCNGKWWWYSALCQDYLDEYGWSGMDEMDKDIEVIAWMPLPEPYKGEES